MQNHLDVFLESALVILVPIHDVVLHINGGVVAQQSVESRLDHSSPSSSCHEGVYHDGRRRSRFVRQPKSVIPASTDPRAREVVVVVTAIRPFPL